MTHANPVTSRQVSAQVTTQLPTQLLAQLPAQPAQLLSQLPGQLLKSRDPRAVIPATQDAANMVDALEDSSMQVKPAQSSEPMFPASPTQSAMLAALLMPELSPEPIGLNASMMLPGPSSGMTHLSQLSPPCESPLSPLPPLEALLNDHMDPASAFADPAEAYTFAADDSDFFMLDDVISVAVHDCQQAQHDSLSLPQASRLLDMGHNHSPAQPLSLTDERSSPKSQGYGMRFEVNDRPTLRWSEFPPYTICRWQLMVMQ